MLRESERGAWRHGALQAAARLFGYMLAFEARHASRLTLASLAWYPLRWVNQRRIRARCMVVRVSDGVALCRVLGHYKMYVDPDDHGHAVHLMFDGFWEMPVTQVIAALVRPGMVAVDVGANQGYYTLLLAGLVGLAGFVHAIEPNARMQALLRRTVAANGLAGRVCLHSQALGGPASARVVLRVPEGTPSGAYVEPAGDDPDGMRTAALDDIVGDQPVDLIKIDAEGCEMAIWDGMRGILARGAPLTIVMEFLLDRAPAAAAFLDATRAHGFTLSHVHRRRGLQPVTAGEILAAPTNQEWFLVLQRGRQAQPETTPPWATAPGG